MSARYQIDNTSRTNTLENPAILRLVNECECIHCARTRAEQDQYKSIRASAIRRQSEATEQPGGGRGCRWPALPPHWLAAARGGVPGATVGPALLALLRYYYLAAFLVSLLVFMLVVFGSGIAILRAAVCVTVTSNSKATQSFIGGRAEVSLWLIHGNQPRSQVWSTAYHRFQSVYFMNQKKWLAIGMFSGADCFSIPQLLPGCFPENGGDVREWSASPRWTC